MDIDPIRALDAPHFRDDDLEADLAREVVTPDSASKESPPGALAGVFSGRRARALAEWRSGGRGRPIQLFVGFLSATSKHDAIQYARGVADRQALSVTNAAYAVFPWQGGFAYEVHEGGAKRAYLPSILRFFDEHGDEARLDDLIVHISTAERVLRIEKTPSGLTAFLMPESFQSPQSPWLEPGPQLSAAVRGRLGVLVAGLTLFVSGLVVLLAALGAQRSDQPYTSPVTVISYEMLPISQWPAVLGAASSGYVESLEYAQGRWSIHRSSVLEEAREP